MENTIEKKVKLEGVDSVSLLGYNDAHLQLIENRFNANITVRGEHVMLRGEAQQIQQIEKVLQELSYLLVKNGNLTTNDVGTVIDLIAVPTKNIFVNGKSEIILSTKDSTIKAKTPTQKEYLASVQKNDIVFAIGPAGTGKTYLAVAMAVAKLKNQEINKIVLVRPAVEAGESLGFLPGDMKEKVDPYLRPLYDALDDMLPVEKLKMYMERRIIEIAPLAYMRGRTLNNAFIILDEAQNATATQMKMLLTRLGVNSKAVITGDITQIDLPTKVSSGLIDVQKILKKIEGISYVYFNTHDVVRHKLVKDIIDAYGKFEKKNKK